MWAPGLVGLTVGALLLLGVRDSPESCGFPPVEVVAVKKKSDGSEAPKESLLTMLVNNVLKNPFIWGMALTYFFVYVVRQGVTSWFVFYLIKVRARSVGPVPPATAALDLFLLPHLVRMLPKPTAVVCGGCPAVRILAQEACRCHCDTNTLASVVIRVDAACSHEGVMLPGQAKGVADAGSAAFRVSGLELGGLFGSLLAGRISDALIAKDPQGGNCGKRVQVPAPCPRPLTRMPAADALK